MPKRLGREQYALVKELKSRWFTPAERSKKRSALWKDALRAHVGDDGEVLWQGIIAIAHGQAWIPKLADGREGPPQLPTTNDRFLAYKFLAEALFGKAPTQEKIMEAERAAASNQDLTALSDEELEAAVRKMVTDGMRAGAEDAVLTEGTDGMRAEAEDAVLTEGGPDDNDGRDS
jgi:hypothetical protein